MTIFGTAGNDPNIPGTAGDDVIDLLAGNDTGNGLGGNDQLFGREGNDSLIGDTGNDTLDGGEGTDTIFAGAGADSLIAGPGFFDFLEGQTGADTIDGTGAVGATAAWSTSPAGIVLNVGAGTAQDGFGFTDSFTGIAFFSGSPNADSMVGGDGLTGLIQFTGRLGNDTLVGAGFDVSSSGLVAANYSDKAAGGVIDLQAGTATFGAEVDTLVNVQRVIGSIFTDTILGSSGNDVIRPLAGNDSIDGREGSDLVDYSFLGVASGMTVTGGAAAAPPGAQAFGPDDLFVNFAGGQQRLAHAEGLNGTDFQGGDSFNFNLPIDPNGNFLILTGLGNDAGNLDGQTFTIVVTGGNKTFQTGSFNDTFIVVPSPTSLTGSFDLAAGDGDKFSISQLSGATETTTFYDPVTDSWSVQGNDGTRDFSFDVTSPEEFELTGNVNINAVAFGDPFTFSLFGGDFTGVAGSGDDTFILNHALQGQTLYTVDIDASGGFNTLDLAALNPTSITSVDSETLGALGPSLSELAARAIDRILTGEASVEVALDDYDRDAELLFGGGASGATGGGDDKVFVAPQGLYDLDLGGGNNTVSAENVPAGPLTTEWEISDDGQTYTIRLRNGPSLDGEFANATIAIGSPGDDAYQGEFIDFNSNFALVALNDGAAFFRNPIAREIGGSNTFTGGIVADYTGLNTAITVAPGGPPGSSVVQSAGQEIDDVHNGIPGVVLPNADNTVNVGGGTGNYVELTDGNNTVTADSNDLLSYFGSAFPVDVDLAAGTATHGSDVDQLTGVDHVVIRNGTITGNANVNILGIGGGGGQLQVSGLGGDDTVFRAGGVAPSLTSEGFPELLGDKIIVINGGDGSDSYVDNRPNTNIQVFLNTNVTNRLVSGSFTEDLLFLDEVTVENVEEIRFTVDGQTLGADELFAERIQVELDVDFAQGQTDFVGDPGTNLGITGNELSNGIEFGTGLGDPQQLGNIRVEGLGGDDTLNLPEFNQTGIQGEPIVVAAPPPPGAAALALDLADTVGPGDDDLYGDDGNDTILAGFGDDSIYGGADRDMLLGQSGDDSISGGGGGDFIFGGTADDALFGDDGDDVIYGGSGEDVISGGSGNDRVAAVPSHVLAIGGPGDGDVLVLGPNSTGINHIHLFEPLNQNASGIGPALRSFEGVDATSAPAGVDVSGSDVGGILTGGAFADTLEGGAGDDVIIGNGGADLLDGGGGDDFLVLDSGNDTAGGGGGADSFFYPGGEAAGAARVTDFAAADDTIVLPAALAATPAAALALAQQAGADAVLSFGAGRSITLAGVQVAAFTAADFEIV